MTIIAVIREGKKPYDKRTPLTPKQCAEVMQLFDGVEVWVQTSAHRCFSDEAYKELGIEVKEDISAADIFLGVKEVPIQELIAGKKYLFFSHTIKKQLYNRNLLRAIIANKITLIDYETLVWEAGNRIIGFGRFAGIVGAHYAFLMWGKKYGLFGLNQAWQCADYNDMLKLYEQIKLPQVKIAITGDGRVAHGCIEVMKKLKIRHVSPEEFLENNYTYPVYVQLRSEDYFQRKDGKVWDKSDFYKHPEDYESCFEPYTKVTDILINAAFWRNGNPAFFTHEEMKDRNFKIKVISDISCDIPGPLPSTVRSSVIEDPVFGYHPFLEKEVKPYSQNSIDVQSVSNLPCELPVDASIEFGEQLLRHVLPYLLVDDSELIIKNATITHEGVLTEKYKYLEDFVA